MSTQFTFFARQRGALSLYYNARELEPYNAGGSGSDDEGLHEMPDKSHVVIVEDELVVALMWREELACAGYRVSYTSSADAALEIMSTHTPSAAIVDIGLPGLRGDAFALKCRTRFPSMAILLVTGFDSQLYKHLESDPMVRVFQKPITTTALLGCLARYSGEH